MSKFKILVIEDQKDIRDLIVAQLNLFGYEVASAENTSTGFNLIQNQHFHLLLLDWMLPGESGVDLCKKIRNHEKYSSLPIIMVTALTQPENIIQGLDAGADDYITKPFDMEILHARVRSQLRRIDLKKNLDQLEFNQLKINKSQCKVFIQAEEILLTLTEFKILETLASTPGHVFTRSQIIEKIQGNNVFVTTRTIDTHVAGLRKKLKEYSEYITTSRGIGYAFKAE